MYVFFNVMTVFSQVCNKKNKKIKAFWIDTYIAYLMFYAQSTAKGHIRAKQNVFLSQEEKNPIHYLFTFRCRLEKLGVNEVIMSLEGRN